MIRAMTALAFFILSAHADETWTGDRLYAACHERQNASSDCAVFIRSVIDRYHEMIASHCAPQRVSFGEIVAMVMADLEANPETRSQPAPQLILGSIGKTYGCRLQDAP
jgi:Rap1a immunity proteins